MDISLVIPTHNQKERLRLVLCGVAQQTLAKECFEVLVVDDGCTDGTREMLGEMRLSNLGIISQRPNQGRNRARNAGIEAAQGELVVFLDGDALPAPDLLERYWEAYQERGEQAVFCGFQYSLPELEYFQDPQKGTLMEVPMPSVLKDYLEARREGMVLTEEMIRRDFAAVRARACEGGYPFPELKEKEEQVSRLLALDPGAVCGWVGFVPHNGAIPRRLLDQAGGFDEAIPFSEGWELAYRLRHAWGARIYGVQANSYHLYHHHQFADPQERLVRYRAIEYMVAKHQDDRLRLLYFWLASLWPDYLIPQEALVHDLVELERCYRELPEETWQDYQIVLRNHPGIAPLLQEETVYENCA
jgi:glycosyltransferase involved in cell wall biosynthesis